MKKTLSLVIVFGCFLLAVMAVNAQRSTTGSGALRNPQPVRAATARCTNLISQVDRKISKYNLRPHHQVLNNFQQRLRALMVEIKAQGVSTSQLETDLSLLQTKAESCKTAFNAYIAELERVKTTACNVNVAPGLTRTSLLQNANTNLVRARNTCQDAKAYMRVVRSHLNGLRGELKQAGLRLKTPSPQVTGETQ